MFQLRLLTLPNIRALVGQFPSWRKELEGAEEAALQVFEQSLGNAEEFKKRLQQLGSIEEELGVVLRKEFHANLRRLASIAGVTPKRAAGLDDLLIAHDRRSKFDVYSSGSPDRGVSGSSLGSAP
jgi:hypothetical protein